ncbi:MAG: SSI family serine proteinase inhibitor [Gaiellales bacterium]
MKGHLAAFCRWTFLVGVGLGAAGCFGSHGSAPASPARTVTSLRIELAGMGQPAAFRVLCSPPRGSFANPGAVCAALARDSNAYLATSGGCDHFHADDGVAITISGRFRGRPLVVHPACPETNRWFRLIRRTAAQPPLRRLPPSELVVSVERTVDRWLPDMTRYTLNCAPPSGTHPHPAAACRSLGVIVRLGRRAHLGNCIGFYRGPSVTVAGTYDGRSVRLAFGGCATSRPGA